MAYDGHESPTELCTEAASGNTDAYSFLSVVLRIAHAWDDLIDKDKPVTDEQINAAFTDSLLSLPANPFYSRYRHLIEPVLLMSIVNWRAATISEREKGEPWTFILRSSYADLLVMTKMITAGLDPAVEFARKVRAAAHEEAMDGYLKNLAAEHAARG